MLENEQQGSPQEELVRAGMEVSKLNQERVKEIIKIVDTMWKGQKHESTSEQPEPIQYTQPDPVHVPRPLTRGRRKNPLYDKAYDALYIARTCQNKREAFNDFILPKMGTLDAEQELLAFESFCAAMKRRYNKNRRKTDEIQNEKRL